MAKSYMNGIIIGITLAVLALFAATQIEILGPIDSVITSLADWIAGIESFPEALGSWTYFKYLIAALIGTAVGIYIEYK